MNSEGKLADRNPPLSNGWWAWGIRAEVRSVTCYNVFELDPEDDKSGIWATVNAEYRQKLAFETSLVGSLLAPQPGDDVQQNLTALPFTSRFHDLGRILIQVDPTL